MLHVRNHFPFFANNPGVVYLDSASTTQKPQLVLDTLMDFYARWNTNASRSSYPMAHKLTTRVEEVREKVRRFINAGEKEEVIFTFGATDAFNKIAYALGLHYLKDGDEVLYCPQDHKSFVLPWFRVQELLKKNGVAIRLVPYRVNRMGTIDREDLFSKVTSRTKVINATHVHNVYGADSDIKKIRDGLENREILINVDATQSVGHIQVDVQELGADILSFSGHKMFAAQGVGAMFISRRLQNLLEPLFVGGGSGARLHDGAVEILQLPQAYEAGTQHYAGILTLGAAIEFVEHLGIENVHTHLLELTQYLLHKLRKLSDVEFSFGPNFWGCVDGLGILSFNLKSLPAVETGFLLSQHGILVRAGDHCVAGKPDFTNIVRVSMHVYNTTDDIDELINVLKKAAP